MGQSSFMPLCSEGKYESSLSVDFFQFGLYQTFIAYDVFHKYGHRFRYTPRNEVRGGILDSPWLSVRLSVCLSPFRVRPVASTVQDGFFPYLVQMINSMRGCVTCDDLWPWSISSRSFGLDLENRVRSVASTVLDGVFLYLAQMITIIWGCVQCYVFSKSKNLNFWQIFEIFRPWLWKRKSAVLDGFFPYLAQMITSVRGVLYIMTFDLDLYLQGHLALALKIVSAL